MYIREGRGTIATTSGVRNGRAGFINYARSYECSLIKVVKELSMTGHDGTGSAAIMSKSRFARRL
ncbi:hypothetical protein LTR01_000411 [Friedmanniomyces endolithicus]|nr:hypothetical protein LTR01_000411 [Friedmanniomyces endolithicus]